MRTAGAAAEPSASWFVSADGHLSATGQTHGEHHGDLPSPLVRADGTAWLAFTTDRIDPDVLRGRAVVLHAKPDNFGNIPADKYPGGPKEDTLKTGDAGSRIACGVIEEKS